MYRTTGHGTKLRDDDDGEEADGYDEALVPVDYNSGAGMIRDDDLYDILVKPLASGVHMVSLVRPCVCLFPDRMNDLRTKIKRTYALTQCLFLFFVFFKDGLLSLGNDFGFAVHFQSGWIHAGGNAIG
jgi:hypothetical protein